VVVLRFSWLAGKVMIDSLGKVFEKLFSRWILLDGDNTPIENYNSFPLPQMWF
jgi:hypothetical protein